MESLHDFLNMTEEACGDVSAYRARAINLEMNLEEARRQRKEQKVVIDGLNAQVESLKKSLLAKTTEELVLSLESTMEELQAFKAKNWRQIEARKDFLEKAVVERVLQLASAKDTVEKLTADLERERRHCRKIQDENIRLQQALDSTKDEVKQERVVAKDLKTQLQRAKVSSNVFEAKLARERGLHMNFRKELDAKRAEVVSREVQTNAGEAAPKHASQGCQTDLADPEEDLHKAVVAENETLHAQMQAWRQRVELTEVSQAKYLSALNEIEALGRQVSQLAEDKHDLRAKNDQLLLELVQSGDRCRAQTAAHYSGAKCEALLAELEALRRQNEQLRSDRLVGRAENSLKEPNVGQEVLDHREKTVQEFESMLRQNGLGPMHSETFQGLLLDCEMKASKKYACGCQVFKVKSIWACHDHASPRDDLG